MVNILRPRSCELACTAIDEISMVLARQNAPILEQYVSWDTATLVLPVEVPLRIEIGEIMKLFCSDLPSS